MGYLNVNKSLLSHKKRRISCVLLVFYRLITPVMGAALLNKHYMLWVARKKAELQNYY